MKKIAIGFTVLAVLFGFVPLLAAQDGAVEEKFYNFDDMLIDGDFKVPTGSFDNARQKARFQRNASLKKSFLPSIQDSAQEDALDE